MQAANDTTIIRRRQVNADGKRVIPSPSKEGHDTVAPRGIRSRLYATRRRTQPKRIQHDTVSVLRSMSTIARVNEGLVIVRRDVAGGICATLGNTNRSYRATAHVVFPFRCVVSPVRPSPRHVAVASRVDRI